MWTLLEVLPSISAAMRSASAAEILDLDLSSLVVYICAGKRVSGLLCSYKPMIALK